MLFELGSVCVFSGGQLDGEVFGPTVKPRTMIQYREALIKIDGGLDEVAFIHIAAHDDFVLDTIIESGPGRLMVELFWRSIRFTGFLP